MSHRDHSEGTVYCSGSYCGIDWTLDSCLLENTGGVVENLEEGLNRSEFTLGPRLGFRTLLMLGHH